MEKDEKVKKWKRQSRHKWRREKNVRKVENKESRVHSNDHSWSKTNGIAKFEFFTDFKALCISPSKFYYAS